MDYDKLTRMFDDMPHMRAVGIRVAEITDGRASMRLGPNPALVGNPETGFLHAGALTALMDTTGALAVFSLLDGERMIATLDLRIDYLRPAMADRIIVAEADCYRLATEIAFVRGETREIALDGTAIRDVATFAATFMLTDPLPESAVKKDAVREEGG
ncbi:MAG: PaaI family thioesterase [Rhodospirillales bacterium]